MVVVVLPPDILFLQLNIIISIYEAVAFGDFFFCVRVVFHALVGDLEGRSFFARTSSLAKMLKPLHANLTTAESVAAYRAKVLEALSLNLKRENQNCRISSPHSTRH